MYLHLHLLHLLHLLLLLLLLLHLLLLLLLHLLLLLLLLPRGRQNSIGEATTKAATHRGGTGSRRSSVGRTVKMNPRGRVGEAALRVPATQALPTPLVAKLSARHPRHRGCWRACCWRGPTVPGAGHASSRRASNRRPASGVLECALSSRAASAETAVGSRRHRGTEPRAATRRGARRGGSSSGRRR